MRYCAGVTDELARPVRQVIGEGVRRAREAAGVRQDDVSEAARSYGLAWSRARIWALESGEKSISAEELILLPLILSDACRREVTLADLIADDARIGLSSAVVVAGYAARKILAGEDLGAVPVNDLHTPSLTYRMYPGQSPEIASRKAQALWERFRLVQDRLHQFVPDDMTGGEFDRLLEGVPSEAERKAAKRLTEDPHVVLGLSRLLWGRSLSEERDRLVDERADAGADADRLRALRGRVTRQLVERLAEEISEHR